MHVCWPQEAGQKVDVPRTMLADLRSEGRAYCVSSMYNTMLDSHKRVCSCCNDEYPTGVLTDAMRSHCLGPLPVRFLPQPLPGTLL